MSMLARMRSTTPGANLAAVLGAEYATIRPAWDEALKGKTHVADVVGVAHRPPDGRPLAALCLSGGGIRSATFNLGVIQGLAERRLLDQFDYLSSVSGGGYIAGWLSAWISRQTAPGEVLGVLERGARGRDPERPEPSQITHLREYGNYLTPRTGLLSLDTWTSVAIVLRNMILNWLVIVPLVAAMLVAPLLVVTDGSPAPDGVRWRAGAVALVLELLALFSMQALRVVHGPKTSTSRWLPALVPVTVGGLFAAAGLLALAVPAGAPPSFWTAFGLATPWAIAVPVLAFAAALPLQRRMLGQYPSAKLVDALAIVAAGAIEALLYAWMWTHWSALRGWPLAYAILAPTLVLGPVLLAKTLFVAFSSISEDRGEDRGRASEYADALREWWARWSAWILLGIGGWAGFAAIASLSPTLLVAGEHAVRTQLIAWAGTLTLGKVLSALGKSGATPGPGEPRTNWTQRATTVGVPLVCLLLAMLIATATQALLELAGVGAMKDVLFLEAGQTPVHAHVLVAPPLTLAVAIGVIALAGMTMGLFVNINRFSLQALYRNRLVRAYLGASNGRREPNFLTDFDPDDNLRLTALDKNRPFPVVNMALNLVSGANLAWQERKATSFTATPLHCGSAGLGYRATGGYGGPKGMSLGTAVAISGAAANPNMGYNSSPAVSFLMALFNARLGAWLPNPGAAGTAFHGKSGPRLGSWFYLLMEAFGWTTERSAYVSLSDGGHFENLALYEMVRRRCRYILVSDAGQDPKCDFDDLGNAIRKVRTDLGISIEFTPRIDIFPRDSAPPAGRRAGYCAIGQVNYADVDPSAPPGVIIYLKPALCETEPYDVVSYARKSTDFPHETTVDQWFSETQFESYRALGKGSILAISKGAGPDLATLGKAVEGYLGPRP